MTEQPRSTGTLTTETLAVSNGLAACRMRPLLEQMVVDGLVEQVGEDEWRATASAIRSYWKVLLAVKADAA
jgi:hypothetical protein